MAMTTFSTSATEKSGLDREIELEYNFGDNLAEAMKLFDHNVIHNLFVNAAIVQVQGSLVRKAISTPKGEDGYKSDDTIRKDLAEWKPKMGRVHDPVKKTARIIKDASTLSTAERAALRAQLDALDAPKKPVAPVRSKPQLVKGPAAKKRA